MKLDAGVSAVVTGGASGLGRAVVEALAREGVRVGILDRDAQAGRAVATGLGGAFAACDVSDAGAVSEALGSLRGANGQERICVNCAGIAPAIRTVSRTGAHDPAAFAQVIGVNLIGTFNVASQSAAGMAGLEPSGEDGERGVIVNTASVAAYDGQIGQAAYAASKAGVVGLTLPAARDLAPAGIRVVTIAPGIFDTPMLGALPEDKRAALAADVVFPKRLGDPAEYGELVAAIVGNGYLNGETIRLDGSLRMPPK